MLARSDRAPGRRLHLSPLSRSVTALAVGALLTVAPGAQAAPIPKSAVPTSAAAKSVAREPAGPALAISVDDGRATAAADDRLHYTIRVRNLGTAAVHALRLTETIPTGAAVLTTHPAAADRADHLDWTVDLPRGGGATVTSDLRAGATAPELLRMASVACVSIGAGAPIVCAADSDQLPAGAAAATVASRHLPPAGNSGNGRTRWLFIGAALLVILSAAAALRRWVRAPAGRRA
jgi:uncharacterized repeat protein (TIGR01451 family)